MTDQLKPEPIRPSRLMIKMVFISALIIIAAGVVYYIATNQFLAVIPFALGVMASSGLNIFKLRMLERTVQKVIYMDDQEAGKNIVRLQYLLRYFMTGVVLLAIGLIHNFTTPPPFYSDRDGYIAVWATLFPNAPEALLTAPFISIWGALFGIFTLQLSVIIVRLLKLEKDGEHFVKYEDDEEDGVNDVTDENAVIPAVSELECNSEEESTAENEDERNVDY